MGLFKNKAEKEEAKRQKEETQQLKEEKKLVKEFRDVFLKELLEVQPVARKRFLADSAAETATTAEYVDWLEKYFEKGGKIGVVSYQDMGDDVLMARKSANFPQLHGANSVRIIVPEDIAVTRGAGDSHVYRKDGSVETQGPFQGAWLYNDTVLELKSRGYSLDKLNELYGGTDFHKKVDMKTLEDNFLGRKRRSLIPRLPKI